MRQDRPIQNNRMMLSSQHNNTLYSDQ